MVTRETRGQTIMRLAHECTVSSVSPNLIEYTLKEYIICFDRRHLDRPWNCTCAHGSLYRGTKEEHCKHIQAAQLRIKNEGRTTW